MSDPIQAWADARGYKLVDPATAARADIVICGPPGPNQMPGADDASCASCGTPIVHDRNVPAAPKVCRGCGMLAVMILGARGEPTEVVSTREQAAAALLHRGKPEGTA